MKNIIKNIICIFLSIFVLGSTDVFASNLVNGVRITINDKVVYENLYVLVDGEEVLVPIRELYKSGKYDIEQKDDEITIRRGFMKLKFIVNSSRVMVNNQWEVLEACPKIVNNRLYIPIEILQNALSNEVIWNESMDVLNIVENYVYDNDRVDLDEELAAKKFAMSFFDKDFKFVERATINKDECYIFVQCDNQDNLIAVERGRNKIYSLEWHDDMYVDAVEKFN